MEVLLTKLTEALRKKVILPPSLDSGGILYDSWTNGFPSRGGEASFPMVYQGIINQDKELQETGLLLADWLVDQQNEDGSWDETPGNWKGTSVFQTMALAALTDIGHKKLSEQRSNNYRQSLTKSADFIIKNITFRRVVTNYMASGAAALALCNRVIPNSKWSRKATKLANLAAGRINREGLIEGEGQGKRILKKIYIKPKGIEIAYGLEMSLASLSLFAQLTGDKNITALVEKALNTHLHFIYPDGTLDNSIGSRGFKWCMYGSKTTHGSQMAWAFMAHKDAQYAAAQDLTTRCLGNYIRLSDGLLGYGPEDTGTDKSISFYPTVTRACNLAFALAYFPPPQETKTTLPCQKAVWAKHFTTLNSSIVRHAPWMATISGYKETSTFNNNEKNLFQVPAGGSITYLFHDKLGPIQAATQLDYQPWETLHIPPRPENAESFCPHIKAQTDKHLISTFWCNDITIHHSQTRSHSAITIDGSIKDIGKYSIIYTFNEHSLVKSYRIFLNSTVKHIDIIEPVLLTYSRSIAQSGDSYTLNAQQGMLSIKAEGDGYWLRGKHLTCPLPSLAAHRLTFRLASPVVGKWQYCEIHFSSKGADNEH